MMGSWVQRVFRLPTHLHTALVIEAQQRTLTVNELVVEILTDYHERGMLGVPLPDGPNGTRKGVE